MSLSQFRTVVSGDFAAKGLAAVFVIAIVRQLPPEQLAEYVYVSALVVLAASLFNGFFNRHYIVASTDTAVARSYRRWQVLVSGAAFVLAAAWLARERGAATLGAALLYTVTAAAFDFARTHAQKVGRFHRYAAAELVRSALLLAVALPILAHAGRHTVSALLAAQALSYLVAGWLLPRLPAAPQGAQLQVRSLVAEPTALYLVAYFVLLGVFGQLPVLILETAHDTAELASFGSAMRYYGLALAIVVAANVVVLPKLSAARDPEELFSLLRQTRSLVLGALALLAVVALGGYFTIPWLDGGKYPQAPLLYAVLCSALVPGILLAPLTAAFLRLRWFGDLVLSLLLANATCAAVAALTPRLIDVGPALSSAAALPAAVGTQLIVLLWAFGRRRKGMPS